MLRALRNAQEQIFQHGPEKMDPQMDPRETGLAPGLLSTRFAFSRWQSWQLLLTWPLLRGFLRCLGQLL